jgi:hypothetical protein
MQDHLKTIDKTNSQSASQNWIAMLTLLLAYTLVFGPSVFARIFDSEFMEIDPRSIMTALDGLTTRPTLYNMNSQYHSQFYGWTYFSLNFFTLAFGKLAGLDSELQTNFITRSVLFIIGACLVMQMFHIARTFFKSGPAFMMVLVVMMNPVNAHYFVTIHPETLGALCQLIAISVLITLYKTDGEFPVRTFVLAVVALSLSALSKQPFLIAGVFIYVGFFISYAVDRKNSEHPLTLSRFMSLTIRGIGVFLIVFFLIHPYAFLEPARFLEAQNSLSGDHAGKPFVDVWPVWRNQIFAHFIIVINFLILVLLPFFRRVPLAYKISVVFACLSVAIYVLNARLFITENYLYPVYFILFFNAFYFLSQVLLSLAKSLGGDGLRGLIKWVAVIAITMVTLSSAIATTTNVHHRYYLDGLRTEYSAWQHINEFLSGTRVVYSPNVAILEPLRATSCSAWSGCGDITNIGKFNPDLVVYSPAYPFFKAAEFDAFVADNNFERLAVISSTPVVALDQCQRGGPSLVDWAGDVTLDSVTNILAYYRNNPMKCLTAYQAGIEAHREGNIVQGHDILIYAKDR